MTENNTNAQEFTGHYRLAFPTNYVSAPELKGKDVTVTIAKVLMEDLIREGGVKERKMVFAFNESPKKLVVNKTNAKSVADLYGNEASNWVGKKITLYPTTTRKGRETVDCIRIRPKGGRE